MDPGWSVLRSTVISTPDKHNVQHRNRGLRQLGSASAAQQGSLCTAPVEQHCLLDCHKDQCDLCLHRDRQKSKPNGRLVPGCKPEQYLRQAPGNAQSQTSQNNPNSRTPQGTGNASALSLLGLAAFVKAISNDVCTLGPVKTHFGR